MVLLFTGTEVPVPDREIPPQVVLDESNAAWLLAAPAMPALVTVSNDLRLISNPN